MSAKLFHLSTCSTCRKILATLNTSDTELVNIREQLITEPDLDILVNSIGSYQAAFNNRAQKLKLMSADEKPKSEADYKKLILTDYTFLKRPALIIDNKGYAGNDAKTIEAMQAAIGSK